MKDRVVARSQTKVVDEKLLTSNYFTVTQLDDPHCGGSRLRHAEGKDSGLGAGAKAQKVEMGWACGATERHEVVYQNVVLGAVAAGIATSRAAGGQMGG